MHFCSKISLEKFGQIQTYIEKESWVATLWEVPGNRNLTSFTVLQLDVQKDGCNYTLIKSDSDSDVEDSKVDIPLLEKAIELESPYTSVGVTCSAALEELQHLLDPTIQQNVSAEARLVFYFDVFMFIPKFNSSTVDCGGHRADSCHLCSTNKNGCNGQCLWKNGHCS